jgi:hypothetical protein
METFSQFIHGKITGERAYKLVALTADLRGRETELEAIAQRFRFWGQQPPTANPIAVGVFHYDQGLLVAQAMSATYGNGQPALDVQGRPFSQHRYIFLPPNVLDDLAGRLWLLLNWVMEETRGIPVFEQVETNLRPISRPHFNNGWYNSGDELEKLRRSLALQDGGGRRVLLSTLAALVNGKRVVFDAADIDDVYSEDLLEGALLLLPAVCRPQVSIAAGALDELVCDQANLLVKTNGVPKGPLGDNLLWAKRANNQFFGAVDDDTFQNGYTRLLEPILSEPKSLNILLHILDGVDQLPQSGYRTPCQALNNGWLATRLIPALPDPKERANYWRSALKNLSPAGWDSVLPAIVDEIGLEIAWTALQKLVKRDPVEYVPRVFLLWRNVSDAYITYTLQRELPADLSLAETLLQHGLLNELGPAHRDNLLNLALVVINDKSRRSPKEAVALANTFLECGVFDNPLEQYAFKEAAILYRPDRADLYQFFNTETATILPYLSSESLVGLQIYQHFCQADQAAAGLLERVVQKQSRALNLLPDLAAQTEMTVGQTVKFYAACLAVWQPEGQTGRLLLADVVTRWIAQYPPAERPPLPPTLGPLVEWCQISTPARVRTILTDLAMQPGVGDWQSLAEWLFADDMLGQVSFLDHVTVGQPVTHLCQQWLVALAEFPEAVDNFEVSYTWHVLQEHGPTWLAEAVAQLLGWKETSISALLPVIERLQAALTLPQPIIFSFLERLPRHGDDNLGLMLAAHLPGLIADKDARVDAVPLWQMLNSQTPKVAQVYKTLAEGEKNVAVDLFNQRKLSAALAEAPEYAEAMAHWLQQCGKGDWISGRLLETMTEKWAEAPARIDAVLLAGLLRPDLTEHYGAADWIALARVCWLPDYQLLWPFNGQPALNVRQRAQVLSLAKERIATYDQPAQTERLLTTCGNWGLGDDDLAELVGNAPQQACNFALLSTYLYMNGSIRNPNNATAQKLFNLAMQLGAQNNLEQTHLKTFLTNLARSQLKAEDGVSFLINWYQVVTDKSLYGDAISDATLQLAPDHFSLLVKRAHQFNRRGASVLSRSVVTALEKFWGAEKKGLEIGD